MLLCFVIVAAIAMKARFIFTNTTTYFRVAKNQNIPNTPLRKLSFSFSAKGLSKST